MTPGWYFASALKDVTPNHPLSVQDLNTKRVPAFYLRSDKTVSLSVVFRAGVINLTPVKVAAVERLNKNFCRCDICSNGYIIKIANSHHLCFFLVISRRGASISEVDKKVDLVISQTGCT